MNFHSYFKHLSDFLHMGGYAHYVWPSYLIVAIFLIVNLWQTKRLRGQLQKKLRVEHDSSA
jgi:heme exporter protein CcmD